jgi:hypothetical protein
MFGIGLKGSVVAASAAAALLVAGISLAKPPPGRGHHGNGPHASGGGGQHGGGACDPTAVTDVQTAVATACPCAGLDDGQGGTTSWKNHGQYVRCVAHATRDQARNAGLKRRCVRDTVPCAARSTCGKNGAVACVVASNGTCMNGACSNDEERACAIDDDCTIHECRVASAQHCTTLGGAPSSGSCCTASPSGAFLDSIAF